MLYLANCCPIRDNLDVHAVQQLQGFRKLDEDAQALATKLQHDKKELLHALAGSTSQVLLVQDRTNELITAEHQRTRIEIMASINQSRSNQSVAEPGHGLQDILHQSSEQKEKICLIEALVLQSLRFPTMMDRFEEVQTAHQKTYEWIFETPDPKYSRWSDFPRWLSRGTGIYWINGKAASGKSTLMRFICDNNRTPALLKRWSQLKNLVVANHFLWYNGTRDQRSHSGLLRALIFKLLHQCTHLIPLVFPDYWNERMKYPLKVIEGMAPKSWTIPKLSKGFERLFQVAGDDMRFCLFIDGLDEYEGDFQEIINLFTKISKFPNVKTCLSSRPLYDFSRAFSSLPGVRLQDFTFNDIKQFVDDELGANCQMQDLQRQEPEEAPKLVLEIVDKADGVFLWVRLVVLSLLRGLRNSDQVVDLQARLRILPRSLEEMFSHILRRLEPVYLAQSSRIFQMFLAAQSLDYDLPSIQLSLAEEPDGDTLLHSENIKFTQSELVSKCEMVEGWLQTRCGGLIETYIPGIPKSCRAPWNGPKLVWLHRTVRDFLVLPDIWSRILSGTAGTGFNPNVALLQSNVLYLKFVLYTGSATEPRSPRQTINQIRDIAVQALGFACNAELETGKVSVPVLDEYAKVCDHLVKNLLLAHRGWAYFIFGFPDEEPDPLLRIAINIGLYSYVSEKVKARPGLVSGRPGRPLLYYAIGEEIKDRHIKFRPNSKMVELLLENNALPNHRGDDRASPSELKHGWYVRLSPWEKVLNGLFDSAEAQTTILLEWLKIASAFLRHGADPTRCVTDYSIVRTKYSASDVIDIFKETFPVETRELQAQIVACSHRAQQGSRNEKLNRCLDVNSSSDSIPNPVLPALSRGLEVEGQLRDGIVQNDQGRTKEAPITESLTNNGKGKKWEGRGWRKSIDLYFMNRPCWD
jgi:hypothetical protein